MVSLTSTTLYPPPPPSPPPPNMYVAGAYTPPLLNIIILFLHLFLCSILDQISFHHVLEYVSTQRQHFLWDTQVYVSLSVIITAQVELKSEREYVPDTRARRRPR